MNRVSAVQGVVSRQMALSACSQPTPDRSPVPADRPRELMLHIQSLEKQLARMQKEQGELEQALFAAAQVQRKLCAPREIRRGRFEIASEIFPARHISADFYNVLDLGAGLSLAVGDIEGKGIAAGLWFTHVVGLVRIHATSHGDPARAIEAVNRDLCQIQSGPPIASLFLARLDTERGLLTYCNAGQPPALVVRKTGDVEQLGDGGPVLGALPASQFQMASAELRSGDMLIIFSDGIVECRNDRDEEFGIEGIKKAVAAASKDSPGTLLYSILGEVQDFAGRQARTDDLTLMVVRHSSGWLSR